MLIKKKIKINGSKVNLRALKISDCNKTYLSWLEDREVNKYLETRWNQHNIESIKKHVKELNKSKNNIILAIEDNKSKKHIGNIKLGPINFHHKTSEISYFIGEKIFWGNGSGTEAVSLLTKYAFKELNMEFLLAGVYESNKGSSSLLKKSGYVLQGRFKKQLINFEGKREDHLWFGINKSRFLKNTHDG